MKWKLFDDLVVMIVNENHKGISDTDNVIGCVDRSQRHVAEHIVNAHNAALDHLKNNEDAAVKSVERQTGFKTAGELADIITGPWRDAEIYYRYDDKIARIKRVEFHENGSGRLVVVLSVNETPNP